MNAKILEEGGEHNYQRLFRTLTETLTQLKECLERIEVKPTFRHPWFGLGKFVSFWAFYNRVNLEMDKTSEAPQIKRFYNKLKIPIILDTPAN